MITSIYGRQWNNTAPEFAFNKNLMDADEACMHGKPQKALMLYKKEAKMSVARITTLNFKSKDGADQVEETYKNSAPTEFAEAEQLLEVRVDDTTLMFVSLYADNEAMERASAARSKRMDINKDIIESMDGKTGQIILNHSN